jgi:glutamate--cysteine ligase catalytic subunit
MGLLSLGTPLPWEQSREYAEHVRTQGLEQLVKMFKAAYGRQDDGYLWGDEVEYILVKMDDKRQRATLSIDKDSVLTDLNEGGSMEKLVVEGNVNFHPEYGRFMLEATPLAPYNGDELSDYLYVERNMNVRRDLAVIALEDPSIKPLTITVYPLMGRGEFTSPPAEVNGESSQSLFLPDEVINRHARFPTLTANIRKRRGEKVSINVPLFEDLNTKGDDSIPMRSLFSHDDEPKLGAAKPGHIYMDSMGFGMGCSCLQVTVQAPNLNRARYLYDSWANLASIFLALSAAAPAFKGFLADQDVRWNVISGSVDDRTPYERDVAPLKEGNTYGAMTDEAKREAQKIPKSRYDSIDSYLGDIQNDFAAEGNAKFRYFSPKLNDINPPINTRALDRLAKEKQFDPTLAHHFAHLYIRDPIVIFNERIHQDNDVETDHFENIQSTNWQTLRFKPPTQKAIPDNKSVPGWRVEFRTMEIQVTDFENAALCVFVSLLGQAILSHDYNWYIPISLIEANMKTAHHRDAVLNDKFHFKKNINSADYETVELSLDEIVNGCDTFPGLVHIVQQHLYDHFNLTKEDISPGGSKERLYYYLQLVSKRASGELRTGARFIRDFIVNHDDYMKDSNVSETINYDLLGELNKITEYKGEVKEFFGEELGEFLLQTPRPSRA